jgi:zinc protease
LGWQMDSVYYGYPDFLAEAQNVLPKLTRADVNRAIKKYLNFENVCVAVITQDAEGLRNDLVSNAPSPIKYANPNMPREVLDEDTVIQEYPLSVKADKMRIAPAAEFFQKRGAPAK